MEEGRPDEGCSNIVAAVYKASSTGCVSTLNTLIERDERLLHKISLTPFTETPLHIAALLGHVEFTAALLSKKPSLADEVNSSGQTPLHLASAEGHTEIVKALLQTNPENCSVCDEDGRIPLHLAAMRGRIEVLKELLIAQPQSIRVELDGCNVLHLCVRYNHLNALKLLVESSINGDGFLNSKDNDGNSVLHLATMFKQVKTIKHLLSISEIKREVNATNRMGYTPLDVLEFFPSDFKYLEMQDIFKEAGARRCRDLNNSSSSPTGADIEAQIVQNSINQAHEAVAQSSWFRKCWGNPWAIYLKGLKHQNNWIKETRKALMVVATVIATMTFQAGITPPGGVWQENTKKGGFKCSDPECEAGTAVLAYNWPSLYRTFLSFNTISFIAALFVVLVLASGFPLKNKHTILFLTITMTTAVMSMALTYFCAVGLATPRHLLPEYEVVLSLASILFALLCLLVVVCTLYLFYLIKKKLPKYKSTCRWITRGSNRL